MRTKLLLTLGFVLGAVIGWVPLRAQVANPGLTFGRLAAPPAGTALGSSGLPFDTAYLSNLRFPATRGAAPSNPAMANGTDGSLAAGTYYVVITAMSASLVETLPSVEVSATVPMIDDGVGSLTVSVDTIPGSSSYNIYIGTVPSGEHTQLAGLDFSSPVVVTSADGTTADPPSSATYYPTTISAALLQLPGEVRLPPGGPFGASNTLALSYSDLSNPSVVIRALNPSGIGGSSVFILSGDGDAAAGNANGGAFIVAAGNADAAGVGYGGNVTFYGGGSDLTVPPGSIYFANDDTHDRNLEANLVYFMDAVSGAQFWGRNLASASGTASITHPYFLWYNGTGTNAGVWRVNDLGIQAYYNPTFAAYTPGATNFERIVEQWESNVATIRTEAGGTGTLRSINLAGNTVQLNGKTITLANSLITSGNFSLTLVTTNTTSITLPTTGTLATLAGSEAFTNKTGNISQWTNDSGYLTSVTAHNILSATHGDTLTASVVRGDVLIGNSTPKWARLAVGSANRYLSSDGTDTAWGQVSLTAGVTGILPTANGGTGIAYFTAAGPTSARIYTFPDAAATIARTDAAQTFTGSQTIAALVGPVTITEAAGSSGLTLTGATQTTSQPALNITQTWNANLAFTGIKANFTATQTNNLALLIDLQRSTVSKFSVTEFGLVTAGGFIDGVINTNGNSSYLTLLNGKGINLATSGTNVSTALVSGGAATLQMGVDVNGAAVSQTLQSANGITGTDKAGGNFTVRPGAGTGAATASAFIVQTPTATSTGTTAQTQATRLTVNSTGVTVAGLAGAGNLPVCASAAGLLTLGSNTGGVLSCP